MSANTLGRSFAAQADPNPFEILGLPLNEAFHSFLHVSVCSPSTGTATRLGFPGSRLLWPRRRRLSFCRRVSELTESRNMSHFRDFWDRLAALTWSTSSKTRRPSTKTLVDEAEKFLTPSLNIFHDFASSGKKRSLARRATFQTSWILKRDWS